MSIPMAEGDNSLSDGLGMDLRQTNGYHDAKLMTPKHIPTGSKQNTRQNFQNMGECKSTSYITLTNTHGHMTYS